MARAPSRKPSRKAFIEQWLQRAPALIREPELKALQSELYQLAPEKGIVALSRLAETVHECGGSVCYENLSGGPEDRMLVLHSLDELEAGMRALHARLTEAQSADDREGVQRARMAARRMRQRALWIAHNQRVAAPLRAVKQEMADWLLLWLEMPDAFFEWLVLRKRTDEFQRLILATHESGAADESGAANESGRE